MEHTGAVRIVTQVPVDADISLVAIHPKNPKEHDLGALDTSFRRNGFYGRIVIWKPKENETFLGKRLPVGKEYWCLAGAGRIEVARQKGAKYLPADVVDVTPEIAATILLADNRINTLGGYNDAMLFDFLTAVIAEAKERGETADDAVFGTGYDTDDVDQLAKALQDTAGGNGDDEGAETTKDEYLLVIEFSGERERKHAYDRLVNEGYHVRIIS